MKHERRIPACLLRDIPALAGMFACFWLFVIPLITEGFRLIRGGKPDPRAFDRLAPLLLNAEATLAFALWREAYRRLGYNPRDVKLSLADLPADNLALMARIRSYMDQVQNLSRASAHYTDILRRRWGGGCPLRRAARATSPNASHWRRKERGGFPPPAEGWRGQRNALTRATSSSRDGGGSRRLAFAAQPRAPPTLPLIPTHAAIPQRSRASETASLRLLTPRAPRPKKSHTQVRTRA